MTPNKPASTVFRAPQGSAGRMFRMFAYVRSPVYAHGTLVLK